MIDIWVGTKRSLQRGLRAARQHPLHVAAAIAWLASAVLLFYRLPFGVSHRDEAFYSAMPYSFALGNRPYFDELAMHQNAALLTEPFFRLYLAVVGSADGIILFNRQLYFVYVCVCSFLAYRFVRRISGFVLACCVAAIVIPFSYFSILALSYNTCGAFGFFCGVATTAAAVLRPRPGRGLFAASLWFLAGVFAYPGYAPALLIYVLIVVAWLYRNTDRKSLYSGLWGLAAGAAAFALVIVPLALWLGRAGIDRLIGFSQSMGYVSGAAFAKFDFANSPFWPWRWGMLAFGGMFVALAIASRWLRRGTWLLVPLTVAAWLACYHVSVITTATTGVTLCVLSLVLVTPVCVAVNRQWAYGRLVLELLWAPSVLAMLCAVYSSANGYLAASLGSLGSTVAAVVSLYVCLESAWQLNPKKRVPLALSLATCFYGVMYVQYANLFGACYDAEMVFAAHDTRVKTGPMRGTIATKHEAVRLELIDADLKSVEHFGKTLTVFDNFATGYLSTRLRPRTFSEWIVWDIDPKYAEEVTKATFGTPDKLPDLVLEIGVDPGARAAYWQQYFKGRYTPIIERPEYDYVILRRSRSRHRPH
ncbi:MAG: hypothetical protein ABI488_19870 [Polyangiaceae bacterium]